MTRLEINVLTGEQMEIELTPAEVAAAEAATLAWEQRPDQYRTLRASAYPSIGDQLDMIYHAGLGGAAFQAAIAAVKATHPKGTP